MAGRIDQEVALLRTRFPDAEYRQEGGWVRIPAFNLPQGWGKEEVELIFKFPDSGYPQNPFYGFYLPSSLQFNGQQPQGNYTHVAPAQPPFKGESRAFFSGNPEPWTPAIVIGDGSNILSWIHGIGERLREGA
jgi:hypothetical protein